MKFTVPRPKKGLACATVRISKEDKELLRMLGSDNFTNGFLMLMDAAREEVKKELKPYLEDEKKSA